MRVDVDAHAALSAAAPRRGVEGMAGRGASVKDAAAAAAMHDLRELAGGPGAAAARDHAAFARGPRGAAALQRMRLLAAALPPVLTFEALATLTASCRKVLQDAAVFHRLIAEGLDAGDVAGQVARAVLELESLDQAAQRAAASCGAPAPASMVGAAAPHVLLISSALPSHPPASTTGLVYWRPPRIQRSALRVQRRLPTIRVACCQCSPATLSLCIAIRIRCARTWADAMIGYRQTVLHPMTSYVSGCAVHGGRSGPPLTHAMPCSAAVLASDPAPPAHTLVRSTRDLPEA